MNNLVNTCLSSTEKLQQLRAAIELSRLPNIGAKTFKLLVDQHGSPLAALHFTKKLTSSINSKNKKSLSPEQLDEVTHFTDTIDFTYYGAVDYPYRLQKLSEPPPYLFRQGVLWPLNGLAVAIVGARDCSAAGAVFAQQISAQLAINGIIIITGSAHGIDSAAHYGALDNGGNSVLVNAAGIDRIYPNTNKPLFARVKTSGCIITELLPHTPPRRDFFPTRNRIIVGLANAVIIVEGKLNSGTWSSAAHALRQKQKIFVWTASPRLELRELANFLMQRGATPLTTLDIASIKLSISEQNN